MNTLFGKTALVTGGTQGFGRAIARQLAEDGAYVVVAHYGDREGADATVRDIVQQGGWATAVEADIRRSEEVVRLFSETEQLLAANIDIVIAAAEHFMFRPVAHTGDEDFETILAVNLHGTFYTLREAAGRVADGGRIIAVSRDLTLSTTGTGAFAASKAGVEQLVRVLAREVSWRGITVNTVAPTALDIERLKRPASGNALEALFLERRRMPRDMAGITSLIASDDAQSVNGRTIGTRDDLATLLTAAPAAAFMEAMLRPVGSDNAPSF